MESQGQGREKSVGEIAGEIAEAASELYERLDIGRQLQEHPYRTLAIAAGIGYVLGGGLFTPLTGTLLRIGARAAMLPMLQNTITGPVEEERGPQGR